MRRGSYAPGVWSRLSIRSRCSPTFSSSMTGRLASANSRNCSTMKGTPRCCTARHRIASTGQTGSRSLARLQWIGAFRSASPAKSRRLTVTPGHSSFKTAFKGHCYRALIPRERMLRTAASTAIHEHQSSGQSWTGHPSRRFILGYPVSKGAYYNFIAGAQAPDNNNNTTPLARYNSPRRPDSPARPLPRLRSEHPRRPRPGRDLRQVDARRDARAAHLAQP